MTNVIYPTTNLKAVGRASLSIDRILQYTRGGRKETAKVFRPAKVLQDCLELLGERFDRLGVHFKKPGNGCQSRGNQWLGLRPVLQVGYALARRFCRFFES